MKVFRTFEVTVQNRRAIKPREKPKPRAIPTLGLGPSLRARIPWRMPITPRYTQKVAIAAGIGLMYTGLYLRQSERE